MNGLIYWIKFDKDPQPVRIFAKDWLEFKEILDRMILQRGQPFEWMNRDYK